MKKVFLVTIMILLLLTGCSNQKKNNLSNSDNIIKEENKEEEKNISDNINKDNTTNNENTTKEEVNAEDKELENQVINNQDNETENNNVENNNIENNNETLQEETEDVVQNENNETVENEEEQKPIVFKRPTEYGTVFDYYDEINKKKRYRNTNIISMYDSPIYSVADGEVAITEACSELVVADNCLNIYVKHNVNGKYIYSVYKYVFDSEVSREQKVTVDSVLGHVGYLREKQAGFCFYMMGGYMMGGRKEEIINPRMYVYLPKSYESYYER